MKIETSKYTGVSWNKNRKKWLSQIMINSKIKFIGYFDDESKASSAYQIKLKAV